MLLGVDGHNVRGKGIGTEISLLYAPFPCGPPPPRDLTRADCLNTLLQCTPCREADQLLGLLQHLAPLLQLPRSAASEEAHALAFRCVARALAAAAPGGPCRGALASEDAAPLAGYVLHCCLEAAEREVLAGAKGAARGGGVCVGGGSGHDGGTWQYLAVAFAVRAHAHALYAHECCRGLLRLVPLILPRVGVQSAMAGHSLAPNARPWHAAVAAAFGHTSSRLQSQRVCCRQQGAVC